MFIVDVFVLLFTTCNNERSRPALSSSTRSDYHVDAPDYLSSYSRGEAVVVWCRAALHWCWRASESRTLSVISFSHEKVDRSFAETESRHNAVCVMFWNIALWITPGHWTNMPRYSAGDHGRVQQLKLPSQSGLTIYEHGRERWRILASITERCLSVNAVMTTGVAMFKKLVFAAHLLDCNLQYFWWSTRFQEIGW